MPGNKTILIIDDDPDLILLLTRDLNSKKSGGEYQVISAANSKEGYEKAITLKPDLIISDILMPGHDGTELGQALEENPATKKIPLIFLTALKNKEEERKQGVESGGQVIFAKPVNIRALLKKIKQLL